MQSRKLKSNFLNEEKTKHFLRQIKMEGIHSQTCLAKNIYILKRSSLKRSEKTKKTEPLYKPATDGYALTQQRNHGRAHFNIKIQFSDFSRNFRAPSGTGSMSCAQATGWSPESSCSSYRVPPSPRGHTAHHPLYVQTLISVRFVCLRPWLPFIGGVTPHP